MFINRDENGKITGMFTCEQYPNQEWLDNDSEETLNFGKPDPNIAIYAQLDDIDKKSIRALRAGETDRLTQLEAQATDLRSKLTE